MLILARPVDGRRGGNPYCDLLYSALRDAGVSVTEFDSRTALNWQRSYDVLHVHWPEGIIREGFLVYIYKCITLALVVAWRRSQGTVFVWTVHNPKPMFAHAPWRFEWFRSMILSQLDGAIFLSATSVEQSPLPPGVRLCRVKHGLYPCSKSRRDRTAGRPLVLGFVGRVSADKGVVEFVEEVAVANRCGVALQLLVAGKCSDRELENGLRAMASRYDWLTLRLEYLSELEIDQIYSKIDLAVCPHLRVANSGSALFAISKGFSVIARSSPCFRELAADFGSAVALFNDASDLPKAIKDAVDVYSSDRSFGQEWSWAYIAAKHKMFYRDLIDQIVI